MLSLFRGKKRICWGVVLVAISCCSMITIVNYLDMKARTAMNKFEIAFQSNSSDLREEVDKIKRLPQAIIIGSRKSGTRALLKFLELNPAIRAAHNEVHFFDDEQNYSKGLDWYRSQMPPTTADQIAIEKSPAYFVTRDVPERIRAMNSSIKLILIMRNPVIRLISDLSQLFANRLDKSTRTMLENQVDNDYMSQTNSVATYPESYWAEATKKFKDYVLRPDGGIADQRRAIKIGMYSVYIEKWLAIFPKEQFHFVDGEELISNPHRVIRRVEKFLNLKPLIRSEQLVYNPKKGFYCVATNTTHGGENPYDRHDKGSIHTKWFSLSSDGLNSRDRREKMICLSKSKGRRHVNVSREISRQLEEFYAPYNEYLYSMTGIKFN